MLSPRPQTPEPTPAEMAKQGNLRYRKIACWLTGGGARIPLSDVTVQDGEDGVPVISAQARARPSNVSTQRR